MDIQMTDWLRRFCGKSGVRAWSENGSGGLATGRRVRAVPALGEVEDFRRVWNKKCIFAKRTQTQLCLNTLTAVYYEIKCASRKCSFCTFS